MKEKWCKLNESLMLSVEALPGVLGNRGKGAFISGEQGTKAKFEGNKDNIGEQGT